ncbi:MAG: RidA family protein [Gemmatimonadales bacterium]|nr:MAG: RidA family protein [Gemmatimonadales bacterium]
MPNRKVVRTDSAPGAIGPYSQAIAAGGFLFVSGQIPLDPGTGRLVDGGIAEQAERVLENLKAVLQAGGAGMGAVVKTTVYLTDMEEFARMNEVYARYFGPEAPARATVQVSALPKGAKVEIDAIAAL